MKIENPKHIIEKFLPLYLCQKIESLGFDDECFAYFEIQEANLLIFYSNTPLSDEQLKRPELYKHEIKNSTLPQWAVASPLLQDVEEWLFNKFKLFHELFMDDDGTFGYLISKLVDIDSAKGRMNYPIVRQFDTSRKARMACIEKMIEIASAENSISNLEKPITEMMRKISLLDSERLANSNAQEDGLKKMISEEISRITAKKDK